MVAPPPPPPPPPRPGSGAALTARLDALVGRLRAAGVRVGTGELVRAHQALAAVDPADPRDARSALRATFCSRREDLAPFEAAISAWLDEARPLPPPALPPGAEFLLPRVAVPGAAGPSGPAQTEATVVPSVYSEAELLRTRDFAEMSPAERAEARRLLARLARRGPTRRSRRLRPGDRRGRRPDVRGTARACLRRGGEPLERRWRAPAVRARPLVFAVDVSGSMEPYARMLLTYVHAAVAARSRVEAFAFGTRLTRITRELAARDPEAAIAAAGGHAPDWAGGTRIGAALATLNREHGRRVGRGAVVVILSDGWDLGDPELLGQEMGRLGRTAHRLVWLNPLKADPRYQPLARGMAAALPHIDHFLAGESVRSLEELAALFDGALA
ncbi:MAG: uncharacterized protein QOF77_2364 [Solirubrobacteraceae bacterium]|nr:uncharacterized protein [Solirubrobacteraceae bacterium]